MVEVVDALGIIVHKEEFAYSRGKAITGNLENSFLVNDLKFRFKQRLGIRFYLITEY